MPARRPSFIGGIAAVLLTLAVVGGIRWAGPPIYDGDGWYHVKYAEVLRHDGISRTFPWFQESFLRDRFTDFNLLYHLLLIPFTLADPLTGARVASVLFAAVTMALFWGTARALRVPWPALWTVALLALAPELTYRLTYTRPFVLAIGLGVAGTGAILLGKRRVAFALAFVYTHWHCSYHLLPCVALLHDVVRDRVDGEGPRARFRTTLWTLGGVAAGSVLTPYFPNNLRMWWVTNVEVLRASWAMGGALRVGTEMLPLPVGELLAANLGVVAVTVGALGGLAVRRRASEQVRTLLSITLGFAGLSFLSQRFVELWAPFAFLLAGVALRDALDDPGFLLNRIPPRARRGLVAGAVLVVAIALARTWVDDRSAARAEDPPEYLEAGAWMKGNVPAGETIFNLGWDEFPQLFYADGTHAYLIGQDPTFMWVTDRERTRLWARVPRGEVDDLHATIRGTFGCRWVFVPKRYVTFTKLTGRDPRFQEIWSNGSTSVVRLDDDGATIDSWTGNGWQPDPGHRFYELPLEEASGGAPPQRGSGFADLNRMLGIPPAARDACATVRSSLTATTGGAAQLGVTTDDEIQVYVNGDQVFADSPYRTPPAGRPGGPPVSLDALFAPGARSVHERTFPVTLRDGANELAIRTCRYGDDFGFVLRRRASAPASAPAAIAR